MNQMIQKQRGRNGVSEDPMGDALDAATSISSLGLSDEVSNRNRGFRLSFRITSDGPAEKIAAIEEAARTRTAIPESASIPFPVTSSLDTRRQRCGCPVQSLPN